MRRIDRQFIRKGTKGRQDPGAGTADGVLGGDLDDTAPDTAGGVDITHRWHDNEYQFDLKLMGSHVRGSEEAMYELQTSSARYFQRPDAGHLEVDTSLTYMNGLAVIERTPNSGVYSIVVKPEGAPEPLVVETFFLNYASVSNVNHVIENGHWQDDAELANQYARRKCYAYSRSGAVDASSLARSSRAPRYRSPACRPASIHASAAMAVASARSPVMTARVSRSWLPSSGESSAPSSAHAGWRRAICARCWPWCW